METKILVIIGLILDLLGTFLLALNIWRQTQEKAEKKSAEYFETNPFKRLFGKKLEHFKDDSILDIPINFLIDFMFMFFLMPFYWSFRMKKKYEVESALALSGLCFIFIGFSFSYFII